MTEESFEYQEPSGKGMTGDLSTEETSPLVLSVRTGQRKLQTSVVVQVRKN